MDPKLTYTYSSYLGCSGSVYMDMENPQDILQSEESKLLNNTLGVTCLCLEVLTHTQVVQWRTVAFSVNGAGAIGHP